MPKVGSRRCTLMGNAHEPLPRSDVSGADLVSVGNAFRLFHLTHRKHSSRGYAPDVECDTTIIVSAITKIVSNGSERDPGGDQCASQFQNIAAPATARRHHLRRCFACLTRPRNIPCTEAFTSPTTREGETTGTQQSAAGICRKACRLKLAGDGECAREIEAITHTHARRPPVHPVHQSESFRGVHKS